MPQQPLSTFNERLQGSSTFRRLFGKAAQHVDFAGDQRSIQVRQSVPFVYPDCVPRQNNALVHIHSRIIPVQHNLGKR